MLSFLEIDPKTDEVLDLPPKHVRHSYLEVKLGDRLDAPDLKLYTGKLYDGVTEADLIRLREQQGLHLLFSNARTAYFGDAETCRLIDEDVLQNFSDCVAYGSLPVSDANASTLREQRRVLVLDDEADPQDTAAVWGNTPILQQDGTQVDPLTLLSAASALGDSFGLVAADLHRELAVQEVLAPLQGTLAIVETFSLDGTALQATALDAELKQLLPDRLWGTQTVTNALTPGAEYTDRFIVEPFEVRRDGSAVVKWQYTLDDSDVPSLAGKALVSPNPDNTYQVTVIGGTEAQQATVNQQVNGLVQSLNTPFQFRAGVPQWEGVIKGTCRTSDLCRELGVDAIIPKSAIKGDGKTTPVGIHTVDQLFWSRKSEAKVRQQKLGAQVLVNLPESTRADIEPKVAQALAKLQAAVADPRLVADLYCAKHERRKELLEAQEFGDGEETPEREDWVYSLLKADARPTTIVEGMESLELKTLLPEATWDQIQAIATQGLSVDAFVEQANAVLNAEPEAVDVKRFTVDDVVNPDTAQATYPTTFSTLQRGGYGQVLEHKKVVEALNRFLQNEWRDLALGGITVPSALAQPHNLLQPDELCFPGMPHGAKVAIYRSPVANVSAFTVLTNNLDTLRERDREAYRQNGVVYLNPTTAKTQLIDFDGDTVALIPELELQKVTTQTLESLSTNEVYVPGLEHGQAVTLYHSGNQVSEFVNNTALANATEPVTGGGRLSEVYLHPTVAIDPKQPVQLGYYDGLHGFQALHNEIEILNQAENRPVQTEKEKKIPRNAYDPGLAKLSPEDQSMAAQFTSKELAALDAAANPTGLVANVGMRLEALRTEIKALPDEEKASYLSQARRQFKTLADQVTNPNSKKPIAPPQLTKDGYDFVAELQSLANGASQITAQDPAKRLEQINSQLGQVERFLFQVQGLNAINLQRGVDTPKSARTVNQDWQAFCRGAVYKDVEWVKHRKDKDIYLTSPRQFGEDIVTVPVHLPNNTQDAVGRLVALTNTAFATDPLEYQEIKAYDNFLPPPTAARPEDVETIKTKLQDYNTAIARASELESKAETEEGPVLNLRTQDGMIEVTNLTRFDPEGTAPLWDAVRTGQSLEIKLIENKQLGQGKSWQTECTHDYAVVASVNGKGLGAIGTLSQKSALALAEAELKRVDPKTLYQVKRDCAQQPQAADSRIFSALLHETGGLDQRQPETVKGALAHAGDKAEAKALRQAANAARQEWVESIPTADREYWARLAYSNQGQGFALAAFPEVAAKQAETFQFTENTLIGLQYEDWEGVAWNSDVTLRVALGTEPVNPETGEPDKHYNKPILQAKTAAGWKLVGTLNTSNGKGSQKDYQPPVGMLAQGALLPHRKLILTTEGGINLTVTPINGAEREYLRPTSGDERQTIKLVSEPSGKIGKKMTGYVVSPEGIKLGRLDEDSHEKVREIENQHGKIFNRGRQSAVTVAINPHEVIKTGTLVINPETVQPPEVWSKRQADSWLKTLTQTGAAPGQVTSEPGMMKVETAVELQPQPLAPAQQAQPSQPKPMAVEPVTTFPEIPVAPVPKRASKVLAAPSRLRSQAPVQQATATPPQSKQTLLEQQYQEARSRINTVFEELGHTPTDEQIDQAIAVSVYRETPDLAVATERLQILAKSPVTQQLQQEQGFDAALAYVSKVTLAAYQKINSTKTKQAERQGNGRR